MFPFKMERNIVLTGFMGTGKTAVGKILAKELKKEFIDTDEIIEEREKNRIVWIFQVKGEKYFRKVEEEVIGEVSQKKNCIIATGGGAIVSEKNYRNLKKNGIIICLTAKPEIILKRTAPAEDRPLLLNSEDVISTIKELMKKRQPYYSKADYTIDTSDLTPYQVAEKIVNKLLHKIGEHKIRRNNLTK